MDHNLPGSKMDHHWDAIELLRRIKAGLDAHDERFRLPNGDLREIGFILANMEPVTREVQGDTETFSPGPWHACTGSEKGKGCICGMIYCGPLDVPVATVLTNRDESYTLGCGVGFRSNMAFANARLIAASPELFALVTDGLAGTDKTAWDDRARAVIVKATEPEKKNDAESPEASPSN